MPKSNASLPIRQSKPPLAIQADTYTGGIKLMTNTAKRALAPHRTPWAYETAPFEIVPGVYYVGNKSVSCHLFDTGAGLLLLDTAYTETTYLLLESVSLF